MNSVRKQSRHQVPTAHHANPYYENDYPHYYGTLSSSHDPAYHSHYQASASSYHDQPFLPSHPYTPRSRYASDPYSRKRSPTSKKRTRPYYETDQRNYRIGFGDKIFRNSSNHNNDLHEQQYQYQQSQRDDHLNGSEDSAEDEEEFLTPLEAEALRNAELNKKVHDGVVTTTSVSTANVAPDPLPNMDTLLAPSSAATATEHQDSAVISSESRFTKKKHDKAFGVLVSFFRRLASAKQARPKHAVKKSRQTTKGMIQTMWVSSPLGDVMDQQQQQEVIQMLHQQQQEPPGDHGDNNDRPQPHDDATKVASLDHIWVFRCINDNDNANKVSAIWTGFDYENQVRLSQHSEDDNGIELYDTHIRKGLFPILVIPKRQVCFYAAASTNDQVSSLEVACLPNSKNVQFVYRCGPPPLPSNPGLVI